MSDELLMDSFVKELEDYWPMERELLALIAEILHSLLLVTAKAHGGKSLPKPLKVPRPLSARGEEVAEPIAFGDFAARWDDDEE